ncbi:MAG: helix-turn-helix domain-containing protein [Paludibacteraceae bacterium]|nr:helix-turn-helix domain-containing protein [Paludibacteraceae bacterium]
MSKTKTLEQAQRQELARMYFMQGMKQKEIADKVGVSRNTICAWIRDGKWDTVRAAKTITRSELVKKMLNDLDEKLATGQWTADEIIKVASAIEKLDKQTSIVTITEVLTAFNQWLVSRMQVDSELTPEIVKIINTYQDKFISEKLGNVTIPIE